MKNAGLVFSPAFEFPNGAEGGSRTHTSRGRVILSHVRLPFRHFGKLLAQLL